MGEMRVVRRAIGAAFGCTLTLALLRIAGMPARAEALPCEADDRLAETAATLLLKNAPIDAPSLLGAARAHGFDGVALHARESASDIALARWLSGLRTRAEGRVTCGEARSDARRLVLAAVRGGRLWRTGDRVYGALEPGFAAPALVLEQQDGALSSRPVTSAQLAAGVVLAADHPPARVQLIAESASGPHPVAELSIATAPPAPPAPPAEPSGPAVASPRSPASLVSEIGAFRQTAGVGALRDNRLLSASAQQHAARVCELGKLAHRLEGEDPELRLAREHIAARAVGEVIARADSDGAALRVLLASPSHRLALARREFTDVGLGQGKDARGRSCLVVLLAAWPRRLP